MALAASVGLPGDADDRIDVTDDQGQRLGWVDPDSGLRTLLVPECRDVFDEVVDFWLAAAGLDPTASDASALAAEPMPAQMHVQEIRFPDRPTVRTLVVPLVAAD